MKESSELKEMTERGLNAFPSEGLGFMTSRIARADGVVAIGTDPNEWWRGHDEVVNIFTAQSEALRGMGVKVQEMSAYEEGSVGWVASRILFTLPSGVEVPTRLTMVYHREDGEWKVAQWHASLGVPNEEVFADDIPT
jgi:hypothetical protein